MSNAGGTERVLPIIAGGLCARGHEITVVSLTGSAPTFYPLDERIRLIWLGSKTLQSNIAGNLARLMRIVRDIRPDVWIDVDYILGVYTGFLKLSHPRMKWIAWEHFNFYSPFPVNYTLRKHLRPLIARFADCLVVLSDEDAGYYRQNVKIGKRLERIYNPSPYEDMCPGDHQEKTVVSVGRLTPIKGYDRLIRIWSRLEASFPNWQLIVCGGGESADELEAMRREAGLERLHFVGRVNDVPQYYQQASCFVLTSHAEGFAMVLLEAMTFALPMIAFDVKAGVRESIIDGETGFVVPDDDIDTFADRLALLMRDDALRSRMSQAARASMARFTTSSILDQWEALLRSL